jgi:D-serine deaminase-like pyridoxal phosphate-dependent protein
VGLTLRPHVKTHKVATIARMQLDLGAAGITVASIGEAEAFADAGFGDQMIAYPVFATGNTGRRLAALSERIDLILGVDSKDAVEALVSHGLHRQSRLTLVVEVESGLRRTGIHARAAGELAAQAAGHGFTVGGVFTYPGQGYAPGQGKDAARMEADALSEAVLAFDEAGLECRIRSGGSTPTLFHTSAGPATETRPGVYAFNDAQQIALGNAGLSDVALVAVATVVSAPERGWIVLDCGSKTIASDRPPYVSGHGIVLGYPDAHMARLWEHHAVVDVSHTARPPRIGDRVAVVPNHVCTAFNLTDVVLTIIDGQVVPWSVDARGRNS